MVAGLTAMVRSRLLLGDQAAVAAQQAAIVPLEFSKELAKTIANQTARDLARKKVIAPRRQEPDQFDLPLGLPDPDELAQAAAKLVRNALFGADGRVHPVLPSTPDRLPTVVTTDNNPMPPTIEERLALEFTVSPVYRWEHGFYGEPLRPFDEHEQLDGLETTDREADPVLINTGSWPPSDIFAPGDHDGCTCEWVVAVDGGE
jgi:hypothetical protein